MDFGHFISLDEMNSFKKRKEKDFFHFWLLSSTRKEGWKAELT